jgi:hypothetical protein
MDEGDMEDEYDEVDEAEEEGGEVERHFVSSRSLRALLGDDGFVISDLLFECFMEELPFVVGFIVSLLIDFFIISLSLKKFLNKCFVFILFFQINLNDFMRR